MSKFASNGESDRRTAVRTVTHRAGKLLCGGFAWDCVIRDVSPTGTRVQMLSAATPDENAQLIDLIGGFAHDCRVMWRKDRELGLKVIKSHDLRGLAPAAFGTAKRIWAASQGQASA